MFKRTPKELYPVLPLRDVVVFPGTVPSLLVGRGKSIRALEMAMNQGLRKVLLVTQVAPTDDAMACSSKAPPRTRWISMPTRLRS